MFKTHKSIIITAAVLCAASLIGCKIYLPSLKYSVLFLLLFVLLLADFFWYTKDYRSEEEAMKLRQGGLKYMTGTSYVLKSIAVLLMYMGTVSLLLVPMVMYQCGISGFEMSPLTALILGHVIIYLTQYVYEIGKVSVYQNVQ